MAPTFNEVTKADQCPLYFATLAAYSDLPTAANYTRAFRNHAGYSLFAKGFVIDIGTLNDLISQNGGKISGIKVYMGIDTTTSPNTFKAVAVATVGANYDDYGVPLKPSDACGVILGEGRPCPEWCGADNALNK